MREKGRADGGFLELKEFVAHKPHYEARFTHGRVAEQDKFEVVYAAAGGGVCGVHFKIQKPSNN